jgi:hypothetical protein
MPKVVTIRHKRTGETLEVAGPTAAENVRNDENWEIVPSSERPHDPNRPPGEGKRLWRANYRPADEPKSAA